MLQEWLSTNIGLVLAAAAVSFLIWFLLGIPVGVWNRRIVRDAQQAMQQSVSDRGMEGMVDHFRTMASLIDPPLWLIIIVQLRRLFLVVSVVLTIFGIVGLTL